MNGEKVGNDEAKKSSSHSDDTRMLQSSSAVGEQLGAGCCTPPSKLIIDGRQKTSATHIMHVPERLHECGSDGSFGLDGEISCW